LRHRVGLNPAHCSLKNSCTAPRLTIVYFTRLALAVQQARSQTNLMPQMSRGLALCAHFPCWLHRVTLQPGPAGPSRQSDPISICAVANREISSQLTF
jgi:hypothetical protein